MTAKLRVGARLRARLRGEVRVYGLRAPARIRLGEGAELELEDPGDAGIAWGFAAAERSMLALDRERRLWSGRLAEMGVSPVAGLPAADLDIFVRLLGLRQTAERQMRALSPAERAHLDDLAAGMNAWTDAKRWEADDSWAQLGTRPRLMGAADLWLLATARRRAARLVSAVPAPPADWPPPWTTELQRRLDAVRGAVLTPVGAGSTALHRSSAEGPGLHEPPLPDPEQPPGLYAETVLPGGDDHRLAHEGRWVRMSVRRPNLAVRGHSPRRPWLRRAPRGVLISDVLTGAEQANPPVGAAFSFSWETSTGDPTPRPAPASRSGTLRLVPLIDGA